MTAHGIDRSGAPGGSGAQGMVGSLNELADPGADRILFWDESANDLNWLLAGTGLSINGTTLELDADLVVLAGLAHVDGGFIVSDGAAWTVESGATARASLGIVPSVNPSAVGHVVVGETASNPVSVLFPLGGAQIINGRIAFSVNSSILTVALKGLDGNDPSASNVVLVRIPQGNPFDGTYATRKVTGALSMTVSNGSTLGHSNAVASAVYVYLLDNAGTLEMAVSSRFFGGYAVSSSTAEGGAGGADSRTTLYSTTARTSANIACVLRWQSTQTSAGVWASATGTVQLFPFPYKEPTVQVFTSTGANTYTKPWDVLHVEVEVQGAGGGGGGAGNDGASGGGGAGGYSFKLIKSHDVAPTETATIGAGGSGGAAGANNGTAGGSSSFGAHLSANGGALGTGVAGNSGDGGLSGTSASGDVNSEGSDGFGGVVGTTLLGGAGGGSKLGGGGRGGRALVGSVAGSAGNNYGGGGGGACAVGATTAAGGAGANGVVIIYEYYI